MRKANKQSLIAAAAAAGLTIGTYSPGDGMTRYRFFPGENRDGYFASSGEIYTASGIAEARSFLAGFKAGRLATH